MSTHDVHPLRRPADPGGAAVTPLRWQQKPPTTLETVPVELDTIDQVCRWLAEHGAGGYLDGAFLRVLDGNRVEGYRTVTVPLGEHLGRTADGQWHRVAPATLAAYYDPVELDARGRHDWTTNPWG